TLFRPEPNSSCKSLIWSKGIIGLPGSLNARVNPAIKEIHAEIGGDDHDSRKNHGPHDHRHIEIEHALNCKATNTWESKNVFGKHHTTKQGGGVHSEHGDNRNQGVAQAMFEEHIKFWHALGPGGADIGAVQNLDHAGVDEAGVESNEQN